MGIFPRRLQVLPVRAQRLGGHSGPGWFPETGFLTKEDSGVHWPGFPPSRAGWYSDSSGTGRPWAVFPVLVVNPGRWGPSPGLGLTFPFPGFPGLNVSLGGLVPTAAKRVKVGQKFPGAAGRAFGKAFLSAYPGSFTRFRGVAEHRKAPLVSPSLRPLLGPQARVTSRVPLSGGSFHKGQV